MRYGPTLLLLAALLPMACARGGVPAAPAQSQPISVDERLFYRSMTDLRDSTTLAIRNRAELERAWGSMHAAQSTVPSIEDIPGLAGVDYQRSMLLLVAPGRLIRGDEVRVDRLDKGMETVVGRRQQEVLNVHFTVALGCRTTSDAAYPAVIVRVPRYEGVVRFHGTRTPASNCE
jgi:hypothetical protein